MAALKKTLIMIKPAFAVLEMNQQGEALAPWVKAGDLFQNFLDTQLPFLYIYPGVSFPSCLDKAKHRFRSNKLASGPAAAIVLW